MKTLSITFASLGAAALVVGCGGTNTTSDLGSAVEMVSLKGTVPGTLIEAFCEDGTYVRVNSVQNGTGQHPFAVDVPKNTKCRIVMTMNEDDNASRVIVPIEFNTQQAKGSTIALGADLDINHVDLPLAPDGVDNDGDHVADTPHTVNVPNPAVATVDNTPIKDQDRDGLVDPYEDDDGDNVVNAYEDDDGDNKVNLYDDDDGNGHPDYIEDDDGDGIENYRDDDDKNNRPDYIEDDDGDGKANHLDDDDGNQRPDYIEDDDGDGKPNHLDDDDGNGRPDYLDDDDGDGVPNHVDNDNQENQTHPENETNEPNHPNDNF